MPNQAITRLPAEWEPQSAVQLTFPHPGTDWAERLEQVLPCFVEIAETISRFQKVLIVCENAAATRAMLRGGNPANFIFTEAETNDTWARDHGGITVLKNGQPEVLDFMFNGWGLKFPADKDNRLTQFLKKKKHLRCPVRPGGLVLEGGGIESDGCGTLLTTEHCLLSSNRNPHLSKPQLEKRLKNLFGLEQIIWLKHGYLAGDDTDSHIDTLARFASNDTILYVQCSDEADEHFPALDKMEDELHFATRLDGRSWNMVALPMPDPCHHPDDGHRLPATYANFLIINGAVLVPTYGVAQDEAALKIIASVFPERETIGIDCRELIMQHGSLHCLTMQYPLGVV